MSWDERHWQYKIQGCKEEFPSFWKTVVSSPQWAAWGKQVARNHHKALMAHTKGKPDAYKNADIWDVDECRECGWMSDRHFQAFLRFCARKTR